MVSNRIFDIAEILVFGNSEFSEFEMNILEVCMYIDFLHLGICFVEIMQIWGVTLYNSQQIEFRSFGILKL